MAKKKAIEKHPINEDAVKKGLEYAKEYRLAIIISIFLAVISSLISVIGPDRLRLMTEIISQGLMTGIDLQAVNDIAFSLAVMYIIAAAMGYGQSFIISTVAQRYTEKLRGLSAEKLNRLPLKYIDGRATGDILSIVTNDLDTVGQGLNQSIGGLVSSVVLLVGTLLMMFLTNWILALTAIISMVIGFTGMSFIMRRSKGYFEAQQANLATVNGFIEEAYSGLSIVRSYNASQQMKDDFKSFNNQLFESSWKSQFFSGLMMPFMMFMGNLGYVLVCVMGAFLVIQGHTTIGVIVAFMVYVRLFTQPLGQIAQAAQSLQSARAALGRVMAFIEAEEMVQNLNDGKKLPFVRGEVVFENVKFGYDENNMIIHNFNAIAKPGQKVAIVGPTGAGKTTIVNLLMRFYEVNSGRILIDGQEISKMTRHALHDEFSMVLQDTWLFEGTIYENLVFNQPNITQEMVEKAAQSVGIHRFIKTLPKGYETVLDDKVTLSVGQKQLMTISRALLKDSPLLILDEATSSVDTRTEELIQKAMDELMKGRTSFVIAHRLSTIRNADLILVMKDGNIIEQGNHDQLMLQKGFYSDLYKSQFNESKTTMLAIKE